nr:arylamine N-acetyltransferase [Natronomonas sp. CBA1123]
MLRVERPLRVAARGTRLRRRPHRRRCPRRRRRPPVPPANHHALLVDFDRPHVVDVGLGLPKLREPLPVGGRVGPDGAGIEWRTVESDRPDADYVVQTRSGEEWDDRYIFTTDPRQLSYFAATCDHLATAPESTFTGDPTVNVGTERGYKRLTPETFTEVTDGEKRERAVAPDEYHETLEAEFGLQYR